MPGTSGITHTWSQSITLYSPSGRANGCSFNDPTPASQNVDLQCDATLPINGEEGDYYASGSQQAFCSEVGTFMYASIYVPSHVRLAISYWANPEPLENDECFYRDFVCTSGEPSCTGGVTLTFTQGCPAYIQAVHAVLTEGGSSYCTLGVSRAASGPGVCN